MSCLSILAFLIRTVTNLYFIVPFVAALAIITIILVKAVLLKPKEDYSSYNHFS